MCSSDLLWAITKKQFPTARLTSSVRPGDPGMHGQGKAIDIAGPTSMDMPFMLAMNKWWASTFGGQLRALIHTPGINLLNGRPHAYDAATKAGHYNHVHVDANSVPGGGGIDIGGILSGAGALLGGVWSSVTAVFDEIKGSITGPLGDLKAKFSNNIIADLGGGVVGKLPGAMWDVIKDKVGSAWDNLTSMLGFGADAPASTAAFAGSGSFGAGSVRSIVQSVASQRGWGTGPQWDALNWIINHELRGFFYSQDGEDLWVVHYQVPAGTEAEEVDPPAVVRAMIGADLPFEILSGGPWTGGLALVAESYGTGRAFVAGDAAHLYTPLGGLGMNAGIGDVMNLGWKLAAMQEGWGGAGLLASYDAERRPIGRRNSELGVFIAKRMSAWSLPADLEEEGEAAEASRRAFGDFIVEDDRPQYHTAGLQLGERYEDSPVIAPDGSPPPRDSWAEYVPLDRAGARLPHAWISEGRALYDLLGPGFTLLDFGAATGSIEAAARARGVPLRVIQPELGPESPFRHRLLLVRPDQHIAWCGDAAPPDALALIDRLRGA